MKSTVRPSSMRPLFNEEDGLVYHAGKPVTIRPVWEDDYGAMRVGHTGDMIRMLDDLNISDRAF